jgi:ATP-binding cassette subfamily F protein uup
MDNLADHLFIFEGDGVIRDYNGNYTDYRQELSQKEKAPKVIAAPVVVSEAVQSKKEKSKPSFKEVHEHQQLEKEIPQLETQLAELTEKLNSGISDHVELQKIAQKIAYISNQIEEKSFRWLELSDRIE